MKIYTRLQHKIAQLIVLILIGMMAWHILHKPPNISEDIYPYLSSVTPTLVKQCQEDSLKSPTATWEDLLAIRSTLPDKEAQALIDQLRNQVHFKDLNWGTLPSTSLKKVRRHRDILKQYTYYYPEKYVFPVQGATWFDDSFGADREGGFRRHEGTDLFGKEGTPIVSICGGKIEQLGWNRLGGERVGVRGDDGNYYYYAHLQYSSPHLSKGKRIEKGEAIGGMGHTGDALTTPDHLHFGIELPNGKWVNPYPFLAVWQLWMK